MIKKTLLSLCLVTAFANAEMMRLNDKEVVLDTDTKLMWQDNADVKTVQKNWQEAMDYCENLSFAGSNDWRLPDIDTLKTLYPKKQSLKNVVSDYYWSSSSNVNSSSYAWDVTFYFGFGHYSDKNGSGYVRCVHDSILTLYSFSSLLGTAKTAQIDKEKVMLRSSHDSAKEFLVSRNGQNYTGTKDSIFAQLFSKDPFQDIQKLTQKRIDKFLIPRAPVDITSRTPVEISKPIEPQIISQPLLPPIKEMLKGEFETKAMFTQRVELAMKERQEQIANLQEVYRHDVEARNVKIDSMTKEYKAQVSRRNEQIILLQKEYDADIKAIAIEQTNKKMAMDENIKIFTAESFLDVMGGAKLENPRYDAETEIMFMDFKAIGANYTKRFGINVPLGQAQMVKENFALLEVIGTFAMEKNTIVLKEIKVVTPASLKGQEYIATLTEKDFVPERVAVALKEEKILFTAANTSKLELQSDAITLNLQNPNLVDKYQVSALGYSDSSGAKGLKYTDDLAPLVKAVKQSPIDPKKWLFAISVEKYDEADPVIYATNSANSFISVMQKRLGIDERHTYALLNEKATTGGIKGGLERLLQNVQPGDSIYYYYSGHGIPDPAEGEPYILPRDVIADYVTREKDLMARSIYKKLSDSSASRIVAFVDSCYSGRTDGISNIKGAAAGHFKSKTVEFDKEKMAVFTAGTNGQFSNAFPEKGNRLFSYYLTKALATKENLDLDTLSAEVYLNVKEESLKMGDIKRQEPQIEGNKMIGLK